MTLFVLSLKWVGYSDPFYFLLIRVSKILQVSFMFVLFNSRRSMMLFMLSFSFVASVVVPVACDCTVVAAVFPYLSAYTPLSVDHVADPA